MAGDARVLVMLASPYAGDTDAHVEYAREAMLDSIDHGEAPIAPHLLYTQVLDDSDEQDRYTGTTCGMQWLYVVGALIVYRDMGISAGMRAEIERATTMGVPVVYRSIR